MYITNFGIVSSQKPHLYAAKKHSSLFKTHDALSVNPKQRNSDNSKRHSHIQFVIPCIPPPLLETSPTQP